MRKTIKALGKFLAIISMVAFLGCSTIGGGGVTSPTPAQIEAVVSALGAFGVIQPLTAEQLSALTTYLSSTSSPDITTLASMLIADGVIPTSGLTPAQVDALITLLSAAGFTPLAMGVKVHAPAPKLK